MRLFRIVLYTSFALQFSDMCFAQTEFVVLSTHDTIYGDVYDLNDASSCKKVVIETSDGKAHKYFARDVLEYQRNWEGTVEHYVQRDTSLKNPCLLKSIIKGKLELLRHDFIEYSSSGPSFSPNGVVNLTGTSVSKESHDFYVRLNSGVPKLVNDIEFQILMGLFVSDYKSLSDLIFDGKVGMSDLNATVLAYNNSDTNQIIPGFERGSITLNNGLVFTGWLKRLSPRMSCHTFVFLDDERSSIEYDLSKVVSYRRGKRYFKKLTHKWAATKSEPFSAFPEVLKEGAISLLRHVYPVRIKRKNQFSNYEVQEIYSSFDRIDYYVQKSDSLTLVDMHTFRKEMQELLSDHPTIPELIRKRKYKFEDLREVVEEYNSFKDSQETDD